MSGGLDSSIFTALKAIAVFFSFVADGDFLVCDAQRLELKEKRVSMCVLVLGCIIDIQPWPGHDFTGKFPEAVGKTPKYCSCKRHFKRELFTRLV